VDVTGDGPLGTVSPADADAFAFNAFPRTIPDSFGYSTVLTLLAQVTTSNPHGLSAMKAWQNLGRAWLFDDPHGRSAYGSYVQSIESALGFGLIFSVGFDVACKVDGLRALAGDNALGFLKPAAGHTREEVQRFLVANGAAFKLAIFQSGPLDGAMNAALTSTRCSPATLDACEATLDALDEAAKAFAKLPEPTDADYYTLVDGSYAGWSIGEVNVASTAGLSP
jgi:hypothetical protein